MPYRSADARGSNARTSRRTFPQLHGRRFTKPLPDGVTLDREGFTGACTFTLPNSPTFDFARSVTLSQTFARALVYNGSRTFTVQNSQVNNSCGAGAVVMTGMKSGGRVVLTNDVFFDLVIGGGLGRVTARGNQFSGSLAGS